MQKSIWMTYILIAAPLGVVVGYGMCALMIDSVIGWRLAFYIQACMLIPILVGIFVAPNQYVDIQDTIRRMKESTQDLEARQEKAEEDDSTKRIDLKSSLKTVLTNKYYIFMCAALTGVFYLCTGI